MKKETRNSRILSYMKKHKWFTLREISVAVGYPEASVSAGIREFRRKECGGHKIIRRFFVVGDIRILQYKMVK